MNKGTIKYYNFGKGYGFISEERFGADIFFHIRDVDESIKAVVKGAECSFDLQEYLAKDGTARVKAVGIQIL